MRPLCPFHLASAEHQQSCRCRILLPSLSFLFCCSLHMKAVCCLWHGSTYLIFSSLRILMPLAS